MHQRDYLHSQTLKTNSDYHWALYKTARNIVVSKIKVAKITFVDEVIEQVSMKPKYMWTRLKQFIPSKFKNSCTAYLEIDKGLTI